MKLIFGLGNPGKRYENTRHNIGYMLVDLIASKKGIIFKSSKFNADVAEYNYGNEKIILVKPLSFMNLSGTVIRKMVNYYKVELYDIMVIHDDLDMDFGRIKFVNNSSSGGHNGIKDIERNINSKDYLRLKIGISKNDDVDTKDYVLGKFDKEEMGKLNVVLENLVGIVDDFCDMDIEMLKSKYNRK
ncbi:MAG: aminoacyl-tRNA hydrolase [Bacilli bacterium]|nr:aminoacyl-tRNA hydrolase [Bacilli bacterium]